VEAGGNEVEVIRVAVGTGRRKHPLRIVVPRTTATRIFSPSLRHIFGFLIQV